MKKKLLLFWRWQFGKFTLIAILTFASMLIIHSCRKDTTPSATIINQEVLQAKSWYEQNYQNVTTNGKRTLNTNVSTNADSVFNYSSVTAPDWNNASTYSRFNASVFELPTDPKKTPIITSVSNFPYADPVYKNKYSRSSFLLLKDSTGYHGYIMTIIADSTYINNDLNKLNANKYNKRDTNFTGILMYHTPDGKPVSAWIYKKGQAPMYLAPHQTGSTSSSKSVVNRLNSGSNNASSKLMIWRCDPFYTTVTTPYGSNTHFSYNVCSTIYIPDFNSSSGSGDNSSSTNSGSNGGANNNSNNPNKPKDPCPPVGSAASVINNNNAMSRVAQNVGQPLGSGFPAPTTTPQSNYPCNVQPPTLQIPPIIKLIHNPNALTADQIQALQHLLDQITSNCIGMALINSLINNGHQFDFSINNSINSQAFYNAVDNTITLRDPSQLTSNSLMEELYHAYQNFTYPGGTAQYAGKAGSANIEFEFKVLYDMNSLINGGPNLGSFGKDNSNYTDWILKLTNKGQSFPSSFTSEQYTQYLLYMNDFKNGNFGYSNTTINYNLKPTAMFSLINSSPCSNQ